MDTFAIYTLGCKVNLYESNAIKNDLLANGLIEVPFESKADIYIINTCTVTNKADSKSKFFIRKAYRNNKDAIIVVAGCMSQINKHLMSELKISIQIGNKYKNNIFQLIEEYKKNKQRILKIENLMLEKQFETNEKFIFLENTRAFIKIQDGCNFMCSYCIIPFSRGQQRSQHSFVIIDQVKKLVSEGYKEIVLTGVNTAGYLDADNVDFYNLLVMLSKLEGCFRIRISSLEPFQISDDLINLVTSNQRRFCQHWHICLQSGSDLVLEAMNRKYKTNDFYVLMQKILKKSPNTNFTTDYIVGFPTETDQDQYKSIGFLKKIALYDMHIFPYSKRSKTKSALFKEIDPKIKQKRLVEIQKICILNKRINLKKFLNKEVEVLFEKRKKNDVYYSGYSSEYCRVFVESDINLENQLLKVKITKILFENLYGEIVNKNIF